MGKRGPQPQGEYGRQGDRTAVLSTRLQPDTRKRLVTAAQASGRSLSQELEHRLRRTFIEDDKVVEFYGSEQTAAVVKLIGAVIQSTATITPSSGKQYGWLKHQFVFDNVMMAISHVLLWFRPGGDSGLRQITLGTGSEQVDQLIDEIRSADPSPSIARGSRRQHAMAMLKDKLGDLVTPRNPYDDLCQPMPAETHNISNRRKAQRRNNKK